MSEAERLAEDRQNGADWNHWKHWGPYLSERAWGTVREDYSPDGCAWDYFPHDHARSRTYRWNEDGLLGISDQRQLLCFALALWNGKDPILKERPFGLSGSEGNHGEDAKDYWFYIDSTPTHSYMKALYKYPQGEFPYDRLLNENRRRSRAEGEFELVDTGIFNENRYFDVFIEYVKADCEDLLVEVNIVNRGPDPAEIHVLPSIWFRNTWSWGDDMRKPQLSRVSNSCTTSAETIFAQHALLGSRWLYCQADPVAPSLLFTENETNGPKIFGSTPLDKYAWYKDGINNFIVQSDKTAVNPALIGTKAAASYRLALQAGETKTIRLRLTDQDNLTDPFGSKFQDTLVTRKKEADDFYATVIPAILNDDEKSTMRQALAGMLWSKQFYNYNVRVWLEGDPLQPRPPESRWNVRNTEWMHLENSRVMSMPDTWEYPWYAAWDLSFHCIPLALVDPEFAKSQLLLLLREWYMHPNGQLPAYEWAFGDVNPPVHAWAARRVYQIEQRIHGKGDRIFLEKVFHKLLLNFTWWVNRKDQDGRNVFQGGFLGLDNIGVFDRSKPLPTGGHLDQSDGTSWMAMFCLNMLAIALELAREDEAYEDVATKFLEHFFYIANAMNDHPKVGRIEDVDLWNNEDGFYYDVLNLPDGSHVPMRIHSMVGLIPLLAVETLEPELLEMLPDFRRRLDWFLEHRPDLCSRIASVTRSGSSNRRLFSVVNEDRLYQILERMLNEAEFLGPTGLRSLSKFHGEQPFMLRVGDQTYQIDYEPAESSTALFGGNSNWRGPIWFPLNYLIIEALQKFDYYYGDSFKIACPTGSGKQMDLWQVAAELSRRLIRTFTRDENGRRPVFGQNQQFQNDPLWNEYIPFFEYFHGDTGAGLGASHQTGWTGLVAKLIQQTGDKALEACGDPPVREDPAQS